MDKENFFRCKSIVPFNIKGQLAVPNGTTLKWYVARSLAGLVASDSHKKRVQSQSASCSFTCKKAFSMSVAKSRIELRWSTGYSEMGGPPVNSH